MRNASIPVALRLLSDPVTDLEPVLLCTWQSIAESALASFGAPDVTSIATHFSTPCVYE